MVTLVIVGLSILIASIHFLSNYVRLNTIPGPVLAGLFGFWRLHAPQSSQLGHSLLRLHEKYGPVIRIGPDLVSVAHPAAIIPIYTRPSQHSTETVCSRQPDAHQYEGLIDTALRNLVNTFRRHHTLDLTGFLQFFAADFLSRLTSVGPIEANDARRRESTQRGRQRLFPGCLLFKGPISRLKRQHGLPFICQGLRSRFSGQHGSISRHVLLKMEEQPSPMEENLDMITKAFVTTFLFLLKYPTVIRKLRSEIVAADNRNALSPLPLWSELSQLKYLQAVMLESLRLSTVHTVYEVIAPSGGVTVCGYYLPQGTTIRCYSRVVHNNAQIYGNRPQVFDPERWLTRDLHKWKCMTRCLVLLQRHAFEHPKICAAWWELKKTIAVVMMKLDLVLGTALDEVQDTDMGLKPPPAVVQFLPRS